MRDSALLIVLAVVAAVACEGRSPQGLGPGEVRANGVLLSFGAGCAPTFILTPQTPAGSGADRNGDGFVCTKTTSSGASVSVDNQGGPRHPKHQKHHKG
jgi:hypothetical protein